MQRDEIEDPEIYRVVVNHEGQHSIWSADQDIPAGWVDTGKSGMKPECFAYIERFWTDMRPLSLRQRTARTPEQSAS